MLRLRDDRNLKL